MERYCEQCDRRLASHRRVTAKYCNELCRKRAQRSPKYPAEMREKRRWLRREKSKRPVTVSGKSGSSTNPGTWSSYDEARSSSIGVGLGYVLGEGVGCVDIDDCLTASGGVRGWARDIVARIPDGTFVEVSQSGRGLHVFGFLPESAGRVLGSVEVYSAGRYIAVTGDRFKGSGSGLVDISDFVSSLI